MKIKKDYTQKLDVKMYVDYHMKNCKSIHELNFFDDSDTKEYLINVLTNYSINSNKPNKLIYGVDKTEGLLFEYLRSRKITNYYQ